MKEGDSDGATRNSVLCQVFFKRPKIQFCSLLLGLLLVCGFAIPYVSVSSCQLHNHTNNVGWRSLSRVPENVSSQPGFQLGALGLSVPDNSLLYYWGLFPSEAFDLKPEGFCFCSFVCFANANFCILQELLRELMKLPSA